MKVAIVGPFLDGTGYSNAIIEWIMSLHSVGVDVVCQNIKMTNTTGEYPEVINDFMKKDLNNVDCLIQYNLPSTFIKTGKTFCIGSFAYETLDIPINGWKNNLELMDGIIVPCSMQQKVLQQNLNFNPDNIKYIPHSCDTECYEKTYPKPDLDLPVDCVKFYTIAEFSKRKNITGLILSYLNAFTSYENVCLIIKTHGSEPMSLKNQISNIIQNIKNQCKAFKSADRFPKIILATEKISNDEIQGIHQFGDVFVSCSHGEAWSLPCVDAIGHGNSVVAPNYGAFEDHFRLTDNDDGIILGLDIPYKISKCFGSDNDPNLYTSHERWCNPDCNSLADRMKMVYYNQKIRASLLSKIQIDARKKLIQNNYSRQIVGNKLKACIKEMLDARS